MPRTYRQLSLDERRAIFRLLGAKVPIDRIAQELGRHRSTIHREIRRNLFREVPACRGYYPITADAWAKQRRQRRRKLIQDARLRQHVTEMLAHWWSSSNDAATTPRFVGTGRRRQNLSFRQAGRPLSYASPAWPGLQAPRHSDQRSQIA